MFVVIVFYCGGDCCRLSVGLTVCQSVCLFEKAECLKSGALECGKTLHICMLSLHGVEVPWKLLRNH